MAAVAHKYDALGAASSVRFWTKQEIEQLIARGPSVSNKGLIIYVRALEHQMEGRELRPMLKDLLEDRAARPRIRVSPRRCATPRAAFEISVGRNCSPLS